MTCASKRNSSVGGEREGSEARKKKNDNNKFKNAGTFSSPSSPHPHVLLSCWRTASISGTARGGEMVCACARCVRAQRGEICASACASARGEMLCVCARCAPVRGRCNRERRDVNTRDCLTYAKEILTLAYILARPAPPRCLHCR